MKHLTNFSIYKYDIDQFYDVKTELSQLLNDLSLDGLELLMGGHPIPDLPMNEIASVHLPFWVTWLDVWRGEPGAIDHYFPEVEESRIRYMCGGYTPTEMTETLAGFWNEAADINAAYAVMHACHVELEHAFTRKFSYANSEVLNAFSELLNETAKKFPAGEPPITIGIENLWWPGLTFQNADETLDFIDQLKFNNWCFVLDTGHFLNTNHELKDEGESFAFLYERLGKLPQAILDKIDVIHLSYSCTGAYQKQSISQGLTEGFSELSFSEKYILARDHAAKIDRHQPFSKHEIYEIVAMLQPQFLVHEFLGPIEKRKEEIKQQRGLFL